MHVVSGKGGTRQDHRGGRTGVGSAAGGKRTLVVEVEGRQGLARVFDAAAAVRGAEGGGGPHGGDVLALAIDPEAALLEYLELFYNMRRAGNALRRIGAIDFATTIAPGVRDVLLTGKAMEVPSDVTSPVATSTTPW